MAAVVAAWPHHGSAAACKTSVVLRAAHEYGPGKDQRAPLREGAACLQSMRSKAILLPVSPHCYIESQTGVPESTLSGRWLLPGQLPCSLPKLKKFICVNQ